MQNLKLIKLLLILNFIFSITAANSETINEEETGNFTATPYSGPVMYSLKPDKGWYLDKVTAKRNRVPFFIYPKGNENNKLFTYIYSSIYSIENENGGLQGFIERDIKDYKSKTEKVEAKKLNDIFIKNKYKGQIYEFTNMPYNKTERVCFIGTNKSIFVITLASSDINEYNKYIKFYNDLLDSFEIITRKKIIYRKWCN